MTPSFLKIISFW